MECRHVVASLLVIRKYQKKGIVLPEKFWNLSKYKKDYQHQVRLAVKILNVYSDDVLLSVINKNQWMFSLGYTKIDELLEEEKELQHNLKAAKEAKDNPITYTKTEPVTFRKQQKTNIKDG